MNKIKILFVGDGFVPTGFGRVIHSIQQFLPQEDYEIHHLAINYFGAPHNLPYKLYSAMSPNGETLGVEKLAHEFLDFGFDVIFILNDPWVISRYLQAIKNRGENVKIPPIVVYFPLDATNPDRMWFDNYSFVSQAIVYTKFAHNEVKKICPSIDFKIIPHGVCTDIFYTTTETRRKAKEIIFDPSREDLLDSFIVLNVSRNQPRKKLDIAFEGFSLFAKDKPENVKYYHHAGLSDMGWDIIKLGRRFGISKRLIVTGKNPTLQTVEDAKLNNIYNATDVGLNCSLGEGWGLPSVEHAVTGAPQIVPDSSACKELFEDCGLLIPISSHGIYPGTLTTYSEVNPDDVANKLELLYTDKGLYDRLSVAGKVKFSSPEYSWKSVAKQFDTVFKEVCEK